MPGVQLKLHAIHDSKVDPSRSLTTAWQGCPKPLNTTDTQLGIVIREGRPAQPAGHGSGNFTDNYKIYQIKPKQ